MLVHVAGYHYLPFSSFQPFVLHISSLFPSFPPYVRHTLHVYLLWGTAAFQYLPSFLHVTNLQLSRYKSRQVLIVIHLSRACSQPPFATTIIALFFSHFYSLSSPVHRTSSSIYELLSPHKLNGSLAHSRCTWASFVAHLSGGQTDNRHPRRPVLSYGPRDAR